LKQLLKPAVRNILSGILIILPLITTVYIFIQFFDMADSILPSFVHRVAPSIPATWIPGLGLAAIVVVAFFTGLAAKNYLGRKIIEVGNRTISGIPLVNKVYLAVQQVLDSITGQAKIFDRVVLVEFPRPGSYTLAFLTAPATGEIAQKVGEDTVAVFVPTSPAPTQGFLIFVPTSSVIPLAMNAETALKVVLSAGMLTPEKQQRTQHLYTSTPKSHRKWNWLRFSRREQNPDAFRDPRD
jgi:uncharacterized membrane protein